MTDSTPTVTNEVRKDNAVTVPKWFRDKHGIGPGDDVKIRPVEYPESDEISDEELEELKDVAEELF